jgi:hypothetical protein
LEDIGACAARHLIRLRTGSYGALRPRNNPLKRRGPQNMRDGTASGKVAAERSKSLDHNISSRKKLIEFTRQRGRHTQTGD